MLDALLPADTLVSKDSGHPQAASLGMGEALGLLGGEPDSVRLSALRADAEVDEGDLFFASRSSWPLAMT